MKVLHITRTIGQGGAEKIVLQLCMDVVGFDHFVASCGGIHEIHLCKLGIEHFKIPDIDKKHPLLMLQTLITLNKVIRNNKINIIHTHHRMAAFYGVILQFLNKDLKHIYTAHNVFHDKRLLMRIALCKAKTIAVGDGVKKNLKEEYKIKNISVIYNAIDVKVNKKESNEFIKEIISQGKYIIGSIGRLSEQKGMDIFIKAMAEVKKDVPEICGLIIGDGELRNKLEDMVKHLKLENTIYFLGYQPNILNIIRQLQFVVLSSRWEGLPLTPIETFSMSKTIIASNILGNNEVISDNENGLLFEKDDFKDLSRKIIELYSDKFKLKKLELSAKETFMDKYEYKKFIKMYTEVYTKMEG